MDIGPRYKQAPQVVNKAGVTFTSIYLRKMAYCMTRKYFTAGVVLRHKSAALILFAIKAMKNENKAYFHINAIKFGLNCTIIIRNL